METVIIILSILLVIFIFSNYANKAESKFVKSKNNVLEFEIKNLKSSNLSESENLKSQLASNLSEIKNLKSQLTNLETKRESLEDLKTFLIEKDKALDIKKKEIDSLFEKEKLKCEKWKDEQIKNFNTELNIKKTVFYTNLKTDGQRMISEKFDAFPWLAGTIADLLTISLEDEISSLRNSYSTKKWDRAQNITVLKHEMRELIKRNKMLEYELSYAKTLYPDLNSDPDFDTPENEQDTELSSTGWISKEEYNSLSDIEKNTLAFERYKKRNKTKWQIGRDFEMYVGYSWEKEGFKIDYTGIEKKLQDMGRDLLAHRGNEVYIIQCKYWSIDKTIHEKHLCQLYGTTVMYQIENPDKTVYSVFVTHTKLSQTAKTFAERLGIILYENVELGDYPAIKANKDSDIYFLPFDQQYDEVHKNIEMFLTVEEAENKGYRRRYKWH